MTIEPLTLAALALVGLFAGFVDAIAGGGGMITVPALLSVGMPPVAALATNKLQSIVGTTIAVGTYRRKGLMSLRALLPSAITAFAGSMVGALVVSRIDTGILSLAVPVALIAIAAYFLFAPRLTDADRTARLDFTPYLPIVAFAIGFYDGLFGPGTGSFFTLAFVVLFGLGVTRAAGHTKALNWASNLGALALFIFSGVVVWQVALVMAAGQIVGGYLGAVTGIRFGVKVIRPLVVIVSIAMALKLIFFP
jgi:uncharacterized membrane protein YfcA